MLAGPTDAARTAARVADPSMISRGQWGANESWRTYAPGCDGSVRTAAKLEAAIVHHTASSNAYTVEQAAAQVRAIYYFHTHDPAHLWCDIGYNFLVDRFGRVFEGRFGGVTNNVIGAHSGGFNTSTTGVALLGTFSTVTPGSTMVASLAGLLAWRLQQGLVDPGGTTYLTSGGTDKYPAGTRALLYRISGHRDTKSTECPGNQAYALLPELRREVDRRILASPPAPLPGWTPQSQVPRVAVLTGYGGLQPAGSSPPLSVSGYWPGWDIVRGAAASGSTSGQVLDAFGGTHPFGGASSLSGPYWPGWDIARGIALRPDGTSGYLLDGFGGTHALGSAPPVTGGPYWPGWDIARDIALRPDGNGGYLLDGFGGIHPFGDAPPVTGGTYWGRDMARRIVLVDGSGGYVADADGGVHPFGNAPAVSTSGTWTGFRLTRGLLVLPS